MTITVSIHAPRGGRHAAEKGLYDWDKAFQSTRPAWGATKCTQCSWLDLRVSIHAPRVGRDPKCGDENIQPKLFQSTRPAWGATAHEFSHRAEPIVSIHAPRVGRDRDTDPLYRRRCVSIHAPRVGRDGDRDLFSSSHFVSIHAPRVGRDDGQLSVESGQLKFQSTRPAWGATSPRRRRWDRCNSFNPRAPRGARREGVRLRGFSNLFQSTRPAWGATNLVEGEAAHPERFQSTRPAWGATS